MKKQNLGIFAVLFAIFTISGTGITFSITKGILFGGILTALTYLFLATFMKHTFHDDKFVKNMPELMESEVLRLRDAASYQMDSVTVGGYLFLTDQRLYFVSHTFLQVPMKVIIPLSEVAGAESGKLKNQMIVQIRDKKPEVFLVVNRNRWVEELQRMSH